MEENTSQIVEFSYEDILKGNFTVTVYMTSEYIMIKTLFVILLRSGLILIQAGSVPVQNVYIILMKNLLDIAVAMMAYGLVGFTFAYGIKSVGGFIGYGIWINSDTLFMEDAIDGCLACIIGSGIICANLSGRMHCLGLILICILYSGLFQPIIIHTVWNDNGFFALNYWNSMFVSVKDHGGLIPIHLTSATVSAIGIYFLGRRIMIVRTIDPMSIGLESTGRAILGYTFFLLGIVALEIPNRVYSNRHHHMQLCNVIVINNLMALCASIIISTILHTIVYRKMIFTYWIFIRTLQAGVSGIVSVSGGVDIFSPMAAFGISILSTAVFFFVSFGLHTTAFEDSLNVIAIHFCSGFIGNICTAICATRENLGWYRGFTHALWQIFAFLTTFAIFFLVFVIIFFIMSCCRIISGAVENRNHKMAETIKLSLKKKCYRRLFGISQKRLYFDPTTILNLLQSAKIPHKITYAPKADYGNYPMNDNEKAPSGEKHRV